LTRGAQISLAMPAEPAYVPEMPPALMTADELLHAHIPNKHAELVHGVLRVREPPGAMHGRVAMSLGAELTVHAKRTGAGVVFAAETGFKLESDPDTVRAPDVAFVTRERVPSADTVGYAALAPDLVVEVLSPGDRPGEVLAKVADWLSAGTRLVWVVDPVRRLARVYRHDGSETLVTAEAALDGEDVLPGFACPLLTVLSTG
jgi:Uma2 family endonuclease